MRTHTPERPKKVSGDARDEMIVDTSRMNDEQREALEVAESAREESAQGASFARDLFMGRYRSDLLNPFPRQTAADREIGDVFIRRLSGYLREHLDPEQVDATRTIPTDVISHMFKVGVFAMKVPKRYGGLGFSQVNYNRVMMMLASYCGSTAVLVSAHQSIGVPQPLKLFGTEAQKQKYFPRFRTGAISAFALTEPGVGSDPAQMQTFAELSEDGTYYTLNGDKLWCTNGPIADVLVVMAKTAPITVRGKERQQITAFIVESAWSGVETVHRCDFMGIRGIQNGLLRFTNVRVPAENLLWAEGKGLKLALATLNTGRLTLPAACTGAAKQCLSIARRWGASRRQWGAAIGEHEAGRQKIADIAATTFAMDAVTWLTSHWADRDDVDIRIEAAMAKLFCSESAWRIVDETMQMRGGRGYEKASSLAARGEAAYPVERIMRETRINTIIEGTSEIMRLFLAREAMDSHLRRAADLIRPGVSRSRKVRAAIRAIGFYGHWYPGLYSPAWLGANPRLQGPFEVESRQIERLSRRLARALIHAMARHGASLEKRQMLLGHLMEIGTEIFAMSCAIACAVSHRKSPMRGPGAISLARAFCRQSMARIDVHFRDLHAPLVRSNNTLAQRVLDREMLWLERGVMRIGTERSGDGA